MDQVGLVGLVAGRLLAQCFQFGVLGAALLFEFGESVTQPLGPRVGEFVAAGDRSGFAFIEQVVLASGDLGEAFLDGGDSLLGVVAVAGGVAA